MILIVVGSWIILIGLLFVFQGGLPDFIPLSMGADNGIIFHIERLNNSIYPENNFPFINITFNDLNKCPIFANSMEKLQSFTNGSISVQITHSQEGCISTIFTRKQTLITDNTSIFLYNNEFFSFSFASS